MLQKIEGQFFEMGFNLLSGIIVDMELKAKMQDVLDEAREKILKLIDDNPQHYKATEMTYAYPFGKQTRFSYIAPKTDFALSINSRKELLRNALTMKPVEHLYETHKRMKIDDIKRLAQRAIEEESEV